MYYPIYTTEHSTRLTIIGKNISYKIVLVFFCVIWKVLQRDLRAIPAVIYKILDQMEPRILANHMRTFADFLVDEFNTNQKEATNYINLLLYMIWDKVKIDFF